MKNKILKSVAAGAMALGLLFTTAAPAQAVTICAIPGQVTYGYYYKTVYKNYTGTTGGTSYGKAHWSAYATLHDPVGRTGYIQRWSNPQGGPCNSWNTYHWDTSRTS